MSEEQEDQVVTWKNHDNNDTDLQTCNDTAISIEEEDDNITASPMFTWDHARFLMEQGKILYHSWTSTDAGLPEFQEALQELARVEMDHPEEFRAEIWTWIGHAQLKCKQIPNAIAAYREAVQILEHAHGHYADATGTAYLTLSKACEDAGKDHDCAIPALGAASRIEHFLYGPAMGPTKSRLLWHQTFKKLYPPNSEPESHRLWLAMETSVALELRGDRYPKQAFESYLQAAEWEREQWGRNSNIQFPRLLRKAALALVQEKQSLKNNQNNDLVEACQSYQDPQLCCDLLHRGEQLYYQHDFVGAAQAYQDAIHVFQETIATADIGNNRNIYSHWQSFLVLFLVLFLFLRLAKTFLSPRWFAHGANQIRQDWAKLTTAVCEQWARISIRSTTTTAAPTPNEPASAKRALDSDVAALLTLPTMAASPSSISGTMAASSPPPAVDFSAHSSSDDASDQEILARGNDSSSSSSSSSSDDESDQEIQGARSNDIAASVGSLGRVFAEFETNLLELDQELLDAAAAADDDARIKEQALSPHPTTVTMNAL